MFGIVIPGEYVTGSLSGDIMLFIIPINLIFIFSMMFWERSNPKSTILWLLVMLLFPPLGFILYLFFGQTFYSKYAFKSKAHYDGRLRRAVESQRVRLRMDCSLLEKNQPGSGEFVSTMMKIGHSYTNDNKIKVYTDGRDYYRDLFEDIRKARETINFEFYIIRDDEMGSALINLFIEKLKQGVQVRVMCDAYGFGKGPKKNMREFVKAGGQFTLFHNRATCLLTPRKNNRNHRKIMVVDGRIGWTGGHNVGNEYIGKGPLGDWRDTSVRIEGGAVLGMQIRFLTDWRYATRMDITTEDIFYKNVPGNGKEIVQIISGGPDVLESSPVHGQYMMMFTRCRKTLYIHTPYLVPDEAALSMLKLAATSGVDVRIIIPDKPDHPLVYWTNLFYANLLMQAGVRIYHYKNGFIHSKAIVADSYYCSVGSANLDERSMNLNFETNAMIYSHDVGKHLSEAFLKDLEKSVEFTTEKYGEKKIRDSVKIAFCRLAASQL
ncbi:MAG: cardiolipin synthase [Methanomassiliicoccaceae archaeon]|nr:cardiolipin synthase [Methanomassiliicoccaceae archaeon]